MTWGFVWRGYPQLRYCHVDPHDRYAGYISRHGILQIPIFEFPSLHSPIILRYLGRTRTGLNNFILTAVFQYGDRFTTTFFQRLEQRRHRDAQGT
jgi:hypothetical protein